MTASVVEGVRLRKISRGWETRDSRFTVLKAMGWTPGMPSRTWWTVADATGRMPSRTVAGRDRAQQAIAEWLRDEGMES